MHSELRSRTEVAERARAIIREVPDFPTPGVLFRDITPLLASPALFAQVIEEMQRPFAAMSVTHVLGIESRGFLFGVPIAQALFVPFIPARKPGKLPGATIDERFDLEYGTDSLSMHTDALVVGDRVLIVDDVLATGGTAAAALRLVQRAQAQVVGLSVLSELTILNGRAALGATLVDALVQY